MNKPSIFISYSHKDEPWKDRLVQHLRVAADDQGVEIWDDRKIGAGADWKAEIEQALNTASVAVLLVSVDFLTSKFIKGEEVPPLLRRRQEEGLTLVPVIVGPCAWRRVGWLSPMQARPKDGRALTGMSAHDADKALVGIVEEIDDLLKLGVKPAGRASNPAAVSPSPPASNSPRAEARRFAAALTPPDPALPPAPPGIVLEPFAFDTVTVDERGTVIEQRTGEALGFSEDLGDGVALDMVAIPGGKFMMGSPQGEAEREATEGPRRQVTLPPLLVGKFAVTQAQWRVVATRLPRVARDLAPAPSHFKGGERPVERVSWHDAVEFCARLERQTARCYRLPSEAEWEYAARAGSTTPFHVGPTITPALVNYNGNSPYGKARQGKYREETTAVAALSVANAFGLFDVHGNVWEWVQDVWHEGYGGAPSDGRAWEAGGDPVVRVLRGGAWNSGATWCRSASRGRYGPEYRGSGVGFRVVCAVSRTQ